MAKVSSGGEQLMVLLVAWEMLGRADLDPHAILRDVSTADLELVQTNICSAPETRSFVSCELIEIELMYRRGLLMGDWSIRRSDDEVKLDFVVASHTSWDPRTERIIA